MNLLFNGNPNPCQKKICECTALENWNKVLARSESVDISLFDFTIIGILSDKFHFSFLEPGPFNKIICKTNHN